MIDAPAICMRARRVLAALAVATLSVAVMGVASLAATPAAAQGGAWPVHVEMSTGETARGVAWLISWRRGAMCVTGHSVRCESRFAVRYRTELQVPFACSEGTQGAMTIELRKSGLQLIPIRGHATLDDGREITATFGATDKTLPRGC